ncbi:glycosyltransferase [Sandaracinus amylolyticus]|uniref:glycosyltransferase n=1 Tax=Sandaracinus amylolyticus TaxID=927083 RepID=UPI001F414CBA|nr:glycosyltransferase [Sandaracinus amylolyticus]UJR86881.1 Hypothetical protein I5071_89820 [Sandaracinus amylolyticus]
MESAVPRHAPQARIVMVIRLLNERVGGAERLFIDTANLFAEAGFEVTCLYCDAKRGKPFYPISPKVTVVNLHGRSARRAPWYRALDRVARAYPKVPALAPIDWAAKNLYFTRRLHAAIRGIEPDLVISFLPPANTPSLIAGWMSGAHVVPTNHNVPEKDYVSKERWDQNPIDRFLRLQTLHTAARVHVIFPTFAEWFPPRIREKIVAIQNYVSPEFENVEFPKVRRKEIVAAGRLAPVKAFGDLVDAWALLARKHPDWTVKIYGDGPERARLAQRIAQHGLGGRVQLMGHEANMRDAYVNAEILAHPALHEGFGLSVAEGLACGLPVVAYADCAGVNEFVRDGENGLMVDRARGPAALADAIDRLIVDRELREGLRRRAAGSIESFTRAAFLARWAEILDDVKAARASSREQASGQVTHGTSLGQPSR